MGIAERKIRQKEETRSSILRAAWQVVLEEGWQALSIRKIAEGIEYSVPVIYDHFENKEAILLELTKQGFQLLNEELLKAKKRSTNPEKQIEAMAYSYWEFAFENKAYYQVMYGLGMPSCETADKIIEVGQFTALILQPIKDLIAVSKNPKAEPFLKLLNNSIAKLKEVYSSHCFESFTSHKVDILTLYSGKEPSLVFKIHLAFLLPLDL